MQFFMQKGHLRLLGLACTQKIQLWLASSPPASDLGHFLSILSLNLWFCVQMVITPLKILTVAAVGPQKSLGKVTPQKLPSDTPLMLLPCKSNGGPVFKCSKMHISLEVLFSPRTCRLLMTAIKWMHPGMRLHIGTFTPNA